MATEAQQTARDRRIPIATRLRAHVAIARPDHIAKNVFVLPGILIPLTFKRSLITPALGWRILLGLVSVSLVACSNYVINEVLDAPFDRYHPTKKNRPVVAGLVSVPLAYVQWVLMMAVGIAIATLISKEFVILLAILWVMGCIYNIPPLRTKDSPYFDVLSESINNPLRMLLGWYMVTSSLIPPLSLVVSYWMVGCYFMALKRFSEFREFLQKTEAVAYRKSFQFYTEESLLVSVLFYASAAMLFFGAFIIRYKIELVLSFPVVSYVMAIYLKLSFERGSAVQNPEKLHRSPALMIPVAACFLLMLLCLWIRLPWMEKLFRPTLNVSAR